MKYVRKTATRRGLADIERLLDNYNWFIVEIYGDGTTPPSSFTAVTSGTDYEKNCFSSISDITEDIAANSTQWFFRIGSSAPYTYYRRKPQNMVAMVDSFVEDYPVNSTKVTHAPKIILYTPLGVTELGDFNNDFNFDFNITVVSGKYTWEETTSSAITAADSAWSWSDENTVSTIQEVTPCVEHDYKYMRVGSGTYTYYAKTPVSE